VRGGGWGGKKVTGREKVVGDGVVCWGGGGGGDGKRQRFTIVRLEQLGKPHQEGWEGHTKSETIVLH